MRITRDSERGRDIVPAFDDAHASSARRGEVIAQLIEEDLCVPLRGRVAADLGAGYGAIARAAADRGASVVAIDRDLSRLGRSVTEVPVVCADLRQLPVADGCIDVVLLLGVLEYAGVAAPATDPESAQLDVLREAHRVLRPGGHLVLASKNRLWPKFIARDPHTGLPLVNILPRRAASRFASLLRQSRYRQYIHSPHHWRSMTLASGFSSAEVFTPLFSYQFPLAFVRSPSWNETGRLVRERSARWPREFVRRSGADSALLSLLKRAFIALSYRHQVVSHGIAIVATK